MGLASQITQISTWDRRVGFHQQLQAFNSRTLIHKATSNSTVEHVFCQWTLWGSASQWLMEESWCRDTQKSKDLISCLHTLMPLATWTIRMSFSLCLNARSSSLMSCLKQSVELCAHAKKDFLYTRRSWTSSLSTTLSVRILAYSSSCVTECYTQTKTAMRNAASASSIKRVLISLTNMTRRDYSPTLKIRSPSILTS